MAKAKLTVGDMINSSKKESNKSGKTPKSFNIDDLDDINDLLGNKQTAFKPVQYLKCSPVIEEALNHPEGIFQRGHTNLVLGSSDSGKSLVGIDVILACQREGILPIIIITELKFSMEYLQDRGLKMDITEHVDEDTGEVSVKYSGSFIYVDSENLPSIESVAEFMMKCLKLQRTGKLNTEICFIWDTIGIVPSERSIESSRSNAMFDASAMATQFQRGVCREINLTRKASLPYYATFIGINHAWVNTHMADYMSKPSLDPSGGNALYRCSTAVLQMGGTTQNGTVNVKATKNGKEVAFGKRTKVLLRKYHAEGVSVPAKVILTENGFIGDNKEAIKEYTKKYSKNWIKTLGDGEFNIEIDGDDTE